MQASSLLYSKGKQLHQEALIPAHPGGVPGSGPKLQPVPLGITSSSPLAWMPPRPLPCPVRHHGDHLPHPATRLCVPELCCCWQPLPSISAGREQAPTLTPGCRHPPPATSSDRGQRGHHEDGHISTSSTDLPPSPASPAAHCLQAPKAADSPLAPGQIRGPPQPEPTESLPAQPHPPFPRVNLPPFHLLIPFSDPYTSLCLFCRHPGLTHPHFSLGPVF